jgi:hypothetical protein
MDRPIFCYTNDTDALSTFKTLQAAEIAALRGSESDKSKTIYTI